MSTTFPWRSYRVRIWALFSRARAIPLALCAALAFAFSASDCPNPASGASRKMVATVVEAAIIAVLYFFIKLSVRMRLRPG